MSEILADRAGQEVACRTFGRILSEWEALGRPVEALVAGTDVGVDQLRDKNQRIGWDSYRAILANARAAWDDEGFVRLGEVVLDSPLARPFTLPARLLYSARDFYFVMARPVTGTGIARRMFSCFHFDMREVAPRTLVMEAALEPGYEPCPEYFLITRGTLVTLPSVLGLPRSEVETEPIERGMRYRIRLPEGGGALAWLRRSVSWPFTARATARELERAYAELHGSHLDLEAQVAARARAEQERRDLLSDLEEKNAELEARNVELERFTYTVSHDLKAPLVTIKGFLRLLRDDVERGDAERAAQDLGQIDAAAGHLERLLDELLDLSRVGRIMNAHEKVGLSDLASQAWSLLAGSVEERGVTLDIEPDMPRVFGDRLRLLEVFQNLFENGIKFMGGQPDPRIEVGAERDGDVVLAHVRDNGIGIEPEFHEKVFGLFDRLDHTVDGTGIGLALVRRIVEVHGGRIWVESEGSGQGSTFLFALPIGGPGSERDPPGAGGDGDPSGAPPGSAQRA